MIYIHIDNKIANKYWEYALKDFDFKSIQNDNYRLQDFIRDKYERKKWINKKKKDPMTLIIEKEDEDDEEEEDDNEESENDHNEEDNDNGDDDDDDNFHEVEENGQDACSNGNNTNKINTTNVSSGMNLFDFGDNNVVTQKTTPQMNMNTNNLFDFTSTPTTANNNNNNLFTQNLQYNNNSNAFGTPAMNTNPPPKSNNNNLLDMFNVETNEQIKTKSLLSNLQQAYNTNQPSIQKELHNVQPTSTNTVPQHNKNVRKPHEVINFDSYYNIDNTKYPNSSRGYYYGMNYVNTAPNTNINMFNTNNNFSLC